MQSCWWVIVTASICEELTSLWPPSLPHNTAWKMWELIRLVKFSKYLIEQFLANLCTLASPCEHFWGLINTGPVYHVMDNIYHESSHINVYMWRHPFWGRQTFKCSKNWLDQGQASLTFRFHKTGKHQAKPSCLALPSVQAHNLAQYVPFFPQ